MIITFLGTGTSQGIPVIGCTCNVCSSLDYRNKRLRSSIHIEVEGLSLVIDSGPDFRQQMIREKINRLDAILFTHQHKDHVAGLDDIRPFNYLQNEDIPIYATDYVIDQLKKEFSYIFQETPYPGIPQIKINPITSKSFYIKKTKVTPIQVLHYKLPVLGFRISNFTYITDANFIDDKEIEKIKGSEIVVLNALQKEYHLSHFSLDEAIAVAKKINAPQTYFIHMGHKLGTHQEINTELPAGIQLAYDGLKLYL